MATEPQPPSPPPDYERRDASAKWIFWIIGGLFAGIVVAQIILGFVQREWARTPAPADQFLGARPAPTSSWARAGFPRLQVSPPADLQAFRAEEEAQLTTYGWINQTAGVVRLPIGRAMDLLLQRGLPVREGVGKSRVGPSPYELQQQRTNSTQAEITLPAPGGEKR